MCEKPLITRTSIKKATVPTNWALRDSHSPETNTSDLKLTFFNRTMKEDGKLVFKSGDQRFQRWGSEVKMQGVERHLLTYGEYKGEFYVSDGEKVYHLRTVDCHANFKRSIEGLRRILGMKLKGEPI